MGGTTAPPADRKTGTWRVRFVFYGRVSTEDWQDPATSRARARERAGALVRGHGVIVAEVFDTGESRTVAWGRRPEAAALVALLADPGRGWDALARTRDLGAVRRRYRSLVPCIYRSLVLCIRAVGLY